MGLIDEESKSNRVSENGAGVGSGEEGSDSGGSASEDENDFNDIVEEAVSEDGSVGVGALCVLLEWYCASVECGGPEDGEVGNSGLSDEENLKPLLSLQSVLSAVRYSHKIVLSKPLPDRRVLYSIFPSFAQATAGFRWQ